LLCKFSDHTYVNSPTFDEMNLNERVRRDISSSGRDWLKWFLSANHLLDWQCCDAINCRSSSIAFMGIEGKWILSLQLKISWSNEIKDVKIPPRFPWFAEKWMMKQLFQETSWRFGICSCSLSHTILECWRCSDR
jgi:hypothetical protein